MIPQNALFGNIFFVKTIAKFVRRQKNQKGNSKAITPRYLLTIIMNIPKETLPFFDDVTAPRFYYFHNVP